MRIAVFGVGGVGGYFGWRLARSGEDVVFIARGENLQALRNNGLTVETLDGESFTLPVRATDDSRAVGPVDAVLMGVKAWQVPEAAPALRPLMGPETFVVPFQNGVEAPSQLAAVLGTEHVFGGLCYIVSYLVEPGRIRHAGLEPYVAFGELDNQLTRRAQMLQEAFTRAGVRVEIPPDIHAPMWEKFLFIATLSGLAAVARAPVGIIRSIPETRAILKELIDEVVAVARARRIDLKEDAAAVTMAVVDRLPAESTTSMQRDIMEGRPSELESQCGAVVRLGREVGQDAPLNSFIYGSLLPQEMRARQ
ncbi:MAG: 2-dehydropantoate 2-reductase [Desulfomonilaceae bacterium]|nr:2-dehydropantoate 2-reductase [Desulfomonilaceae bacterium]